MIPTPEALIKSIHMPRHIRRTFVATLVMGLAAHLYVFTNKLPNHDDINHLFQSDYGTASGRWLLPTVLSWDGNFSMPWLIGLLSLLALALTACISVELLHIRGLLACVITAALVVAFPVVTSTFTYMFTADAYFFGLLLAAFGAFAVTRLPIMGLPLGAIAIICSMGIYQSYFPVAAVLMVGALLFDCLEGVLSVREIFWRGVKMVGALTLGILVYMAVARWLMADSGGLSDYMGISSMGSLSLSALPELIGKCYDTYREYFLDNTLGWYFSFMQTLFLLALVCAVGLLLLLIMRRKVGVVRGLLALVLVAIYPLAGNLIHIMVAGEDIHYLMVYGAVYVLVLPVALADFACAQNADFGSLRKGLAALLSGVVFLVISLAAYNYIVTDNKLYLKQEISLDQLEAYSNRLITAIQSSEGYSTEVPILLAGNSGVQLGTEATEALRETQVTGIMEYTTYINQYSYGSYLNRFLALPNAVYLDDLARDDLDAIRSNTVPTMSVYPAEGSIQMADGILVVRLS